MVSLEEAVVKGLAPDRGLYMPERLPRLPEEFFRRLPEMSLSGDGRGSGHRTFRRGC